MKTESLCVNVSSCRMDETSPKCCASGGAMREENNRTKLHNLRVEKLSLSHTHYKGKKDELFRALRWSLHDDNSGSRVSDKFPLSTSPHFSRDCLCRPFSKHIILIILMSSPWHKRGKTAVYNRRALSMFTSRNCEIINYMDIRVAGLLNSITHSWEPWTVMNALVQGSWENFGAFLSRKTSMEPCWRTESFKTSFVWCFQCFNAV